MTPTRRVWVNHAVTVDATPATGPSGLGGMNCSVNGAAAQTYPASGLTVDGDGVKTVSCTAWNNAVDPQGNHNSGTSSVTVHIDEASPALSLEPVNPNDPTGLVADTSDSESGVAGGSIEMAPAGTSSWTSLPTTFNGSQLVAHFDDAGSAWPIHVPGPILRQRRQLRVNHPDARRCRRERRRVSEVSLAADSDCAMRERAVKLAARPKRLDGPLQGMSAARQADEAGLSARAAWKPGFARRVLGVPIADGGNASHGGRLRRASCDRCHIRGASARGAGNHAPSP